MVFSIKMSIKNILYITPSDIDDLLKKNVLELVKQRDEDGFFNNVLSLIPIAKNNKKINVSSHIKIIQYGWKSKFNFLNKLKITKIFGTLLILFKLAFIFPFQIKKEKISIIRATDPYYMGLIALYYSKIFKVPFVVSIHSNYDLGEKLKGQTFNILGSRQLAKKLELFIYQKANLILPIREFLKPKTKIEQNKIKIFPHGISFADFDKTKFIDIKNRFNIEENKKIISFVGRVSKENYIFDVIKIAKELQKIRSDFIFLIVGDGVERKNMQNQIVESQLQNLCLDIGFQNREVVNNVRKQSFISFSLMGGFSLIEACAGARPVISYNVEWHYELVKNNKTGFLIKENNISEVVEKIDFLIKNPEIANSIGKNARELAFNRHEIKNTVKIKQNIYKELLIEYYGKER